MRKKKTDQEKIVNFFNTACRNFKDSWRASCWESQEDQDRHFDLLTSSIPWQNGGSILDIGCGQGDLYRLVKERNKDMHYTGIDVSPLMVCNANSRYPDGNFACIDFLSDAFPDIKYTYVLAIGAFNLKVSDQKNYIERCISRMLKHATAGVMFCLTSDKGDSSGRYEQIYYYQPSEVLSYCLSLTPKVIINHGSLPHEMAVYMSPRDI
jgi:cyclopropane fatty-acyl-phospholipid synthase-like methyltransferase